jgi:RimJ/RimL family protein N-acetyltransferase
MTSVVLRDWRDSDLQPYSAMNADADVMRYFLAPLSPEESAQSFARMREALANQGWGVWAVEIDGLFAGVTGFQNPRFTLPFSPCTEILWRFRREYWGRGFACDAATHALDLGFSRGMFAEVVAFTTLPNLRSIRLMERLGFRRDLAGDFDHPEVPVGHPLRRHVLYRHARPETP